METSEQILFFSLTAIIALIVGIIAGRFLLKKFFKKIEKEASDKAKNILREAELQGEVVKKEKLLEAKDAFNKMKSEVDADINRRKNIAMQNENKLKQRDQQVNQKLNELTRKEDEIELLKNRLSAGNEQLAKRKEDVEKLHQEEVTRLEKIANLSAEQASQQLVETLKDDAKTKAAAYATEYLEEAKLSAQKDAKKIIIQTIQRLATEASIENSVSVFHLDNEEIKGRIIGREGRNIRTLEDATGVEIIVDDTPDAIVLSCFDPIRREIARLALHRLVADGRIHPARIEEVVEKITKGIHDEIIQIGEKTSIELGIHGLHPELSKLIGRMRYRASYGQNLLHHSRETAHLCSIMAAELHVNPKLAARAGLLHDIGKVYFEDTETPHALLGMKLAQKYNENPAVCNAIGAHHDEIEMNHIISPIVQACDAISGARPGARREVTDMYNKRIKDLENIAMTYQGVNKAFAIQAGRELRVIVEAEVVNDQQAQQISSDLATKIQTDMQYPGQIKITVIRETRAVAIAK